ncbi:MAG: putative transcriptional regulator [Natronomonas sp.]
MSAASQTFTVQQPVDSPEANDALDEGDIHDVLGNDRRRLAIEVLRERDGTGAVRDLAEVVAARETGESPPPRDKRQSVYVSLHQTHLPKLDDLGIVEYDADSKAVRLRDRVKEVEVYMEVVPQYGLSWGEFYFGLGVLGVLSIIAVLIGVPGISGVGMSLLAGTFFLVLMAAAAYQVYSQQDRIVFQRLLE